MRWLEKYMYYLCESKNFLDMLIGRLTADMYQIFKEKKYK